MKLLSAFILSFGLSTSVFASPFSKILLDLHINQIGMTAMTCQEYIDLPRSEETDDLIYASSLSFFSGVNAGLAAATLYQITLDPSAPPPLSPIVNTFSIIGGDKRLILDTIYKECKSSDDLDHKTVGGVLFYLANVEYLKHLKN